MGGLNGHISHLYDNPSLKFSQIKDIFNKAAQGDLVGSEKTDGQNLFLSYSVKSKQAKAARNKGNIKDGGLNARELAEKFADRGNLTDAFVESFRAWESIVSGMPVEKQLQVFGPDANIFYNAEIQDPRNPNVIHYDAKNLVIHRDGHIEVDKASGNIDELETSDNWELLNSYLEQQGEGEEYTVSGKAMSRLQALDDGEIANNAIKSLDAVISAVGVSDNQTIAEFLIERLKDIVVQQHKFNDNTHSEVVKRLIGAKGVTLNTIFKTIPKTSVQDREAARRIVKNSKALFKIAIQPIEKIIHDFSVEVLSAFHSAFVLDHGKEVERLQKEVAIAIQAIEKSGNEEAMKILQQQLTKLKSVDNVRSASEGFVFEYEGKTYKFTGNFAPINQILGLFKFGRGSKIPAMAIQEEDDSTGTTKIAVVPGSYKPPHAGHLMGVTYFLTKLDADKVVIMISPRSRSSNDDSLEITAEQAKAVWDIFVKDVPQVEVVISPVTSPIQATYDYMETMKPGDKLFLGSGEKDIEDTRFKRAQEWSDKKNLGVTVERVLTPMNSAGVSATDLRNAISQGNQDYFFDAMPSHLGMDDLQKIWDTVNKKSANFLDLKELLSMLDENSAMGAGAVAGFAKDLEENDTPTSSGISDDFYKSQNDDDLYIGLSDSEKAYLKGYLEQRGYPIFSRKQKQKYINKWRRKNSSLPKTVAESSNRSDEMIKRKEFLEEERLRNIIRKTLKINERKAKLEKEQVLKEENKLRTYVRMFIKEAADAIPHESTGINVLEDLLKKVVPIVERDYKSLTTDATQRQSFRSHIIKAVQNLLAPANLDYDSVQQDEPMMESLGIEEAEVDIDVKEDEKFIDIDGNGVPDAQEQEEDTFSIPGEDETGRNVALQSFDKIEKTIEAAYEVLSNDQDKTLFYDYLVTNLKLYFDKFEDELSTSVTEPTSDLYNKEQGPEDMGSEKSMSGEVPNEMGQDMGSENPMDQSFDQEPQEDEELDLRV